MNTTIERCEKCNGHGEVPSGHVDMWGRSCWRMCPVCEGLGAVEIDPEPEPPAPTQEAPVNIPVTAGENGTIKVGGYTVTAPGFTAESFDRAVERAFVDGLRVAATDRSDMVLVTNPRNGASYTVSRTSCTCKAGQAHTPCKHVAIAILSADVWHSLPQPSGRVA